MLVDLDALSIAQFHDAKLTDPAWPNAASSHALEGAWRWIDANHRFNGLLWNEEDRARRTDVEPSEVAASKRLIDRHNQLRNDAVEAIDEVILQMLCNVMRSPGARLSSETAGAMIDRLSILALKIFHMREQTRRTDAGADHIDACTTKLRRLAMQRADLASCLDQLLADARVGLAHFKVYRQFKMYNDPALNPYLYARHAATAPDKAAPCIDILIPTCNRPCALAVVLTALSAQNFERFRIVVSDQSDEEGMFSTPEVVAIMRILRAHGVPVLTLRNMPRRGMAEQRAFLLANATAPYCLFLDDDVIIENDLLQRLYDAIREQQCGFVGSALHGLSYGAEQRPHEQHIEFWDGRVTPEELAPGCSAWARHHLHNAANLFHVQSRLNLTRDTTRHYRVAWVGGCVLFDAAKLREAGGFSFWHELPSKHCGEDVLAQVRVMAKFGGCGIIPSGAYHMELPTTIVARQFDAPTMLHPAGSG